MLLLGETSVQVQALQPRSQVLVCLHAVLLWKEREGSDFRYSIRSLCIPLMFIINCQFMNNQNPEEVTR